MTAWNQPNAEDVQEALTQRATAKAEVRIAELNLEIFGAKMSKEKPRDTAVRVIGVDETTFQESLGLRKALLEARAKLDRFEAAVEYLQYAKEMYKAQSYNGRA